MGKEVIQALKVNGRLVREEADKKKLQNNSQSKKKIIPPIRREMNLLEHIEKRNDKEDNFEDELKEVIRLGSYENKGVTPGRVTLYSSAVTEKLLARIYLMKGKEYRNIYDWNDRIK